MTKAWLKCDRINLDYFKAKLVNIPKITILQGQRISPGATHRRTAKGLSPDTALKSGLN